MDNLPETISINEQAEAAGRRRAGEIRHGTDDIDRLAEGIRQFCDAQLPSSNALSTARTNFDQAIYWLRTHRNARGE